MILRAFKKASQLLLKTASYLDESGVKILLYHSISDDYLDPYAVAVDDFNMQMKWIRDNGFRVISLKDALSSFDNGPALKRSIVLTFDDGFVDFFEHGISVLKRYDFKAAIFVVVSEAGGLSSWRGQGLNRRLMSWASLREVSGAGHTIGSHGLHHYDLSGLAQEELDRDVFLSKEAIEDKLGIGVDVFSYPWGICTGREARSVQRAGYRCAVTSVGSGYNTSAANRFLLKRIPVKRKDSLDGFIKKII